MLGNCPGVNNNSFFAVAKQDQQAWDNDATVWMKRVTCVSALLTILCLHVMELWTFNLEQVTDSGTKKNVLGVKEPKLSLGTIDSQCSCVHWIRTVHEWSILSIILWSIELSYFRSSKQAHKTTTKWEKPHQHTCNTMNRDKKIYIFNSSNKNKIMKNKSLKHNIFILYVWIIYIQTLYHLEKRN